ncbi:MAG: hypothetical protein ACREVW_04530 [Burkholderiales bacterium]
MEQLKELCRRILRTDQSDRQVARHIGCSASTVGRYRRQLAKQDLTWPQVEPLDVLALDRLLNPSRWSSKKPFVEPGSTPKSRTVVKGWKTSNLA